MAIYSEKVMEHFTNPRNVGVIANPDGVGEVGNPVCGDMMTFYIKVRDDRLKDVKFQTFGCGAAIAVSSMVSEMAKGKTLDEAASISKEVVAEALGGLPVQKMHCSNLGADALRKAIDDYRNKQQKGAEEKGKKKEAPTGSKEEEKCVCPYCSSPTPTSYPFCQACHTRFNFCPECKKVVPRDVQTCPSCGASLNPKIAESTEERNKL